MSDSDSSQKPVRSVVHRGGWANAVVSRLEMPDGTIRVVKDVASSPWLFRAFWCRYFLRREVRMLQRVEDLGIAPRHARMDGPDCMSEDFVPSRTLHDCVLALKAAPGRRGEILPVSFFDEFDRAVALLHARGFVHLDLHNGRNVLVTPEFHPVLIDWPSAVPTRFFPRFLRRFLERIDLAGCTKFRSKIYPETLSEDEKKRLRRFYRLREFWPRPLRHPKIRG